MLDHITQLHYEGNIPDMVYGDRQYDLIERYQKVSGKGFVPPQVERTLRWSAVDPFQPIECSRFEWDVKKFDHVPTGIVEEVVKKSGRQILNNVSSSSTERATSLVQGKVIRNVAPRNITPMKVPGKQKCRHSDEGINDDACRKDMESGHTELMQVTRTHSDSVPAGCTWAQQ